MNDTTNPTASDVTKESDASPERALESPGEVVQTDAATVQIAAAKPPASDATKMSEKAPEPAVETSREVLQTDAATTKIGEANLPASDSTRTSEKPFEQPLKTPGEISPTDGTTTVQFSAANYTVNRNETASALITVTRLGPITGTTTVQWATDSGGNGYVPASGTLTFEPGETRQAFAVEVTDKLSDQPTIVSLVLSTPVGAKLGSPSKSQVRFVAPRNIFALFNPETANVLKHIGLAVSLILGFYLLSDFILKKGETHSSEWASYLKPHTSQPAYETSGMLKDFFSPAEKERFAQQLATIRERMQLHLAVMDFYYTRYYMAIITSSLAAALAAVALILISKSGWQQTSNYIITMFFVAAAASVFYGAFPGVFQQQQNITDNKLLYLKYAALENEVLSYAVTGEGVKYDVTPGEIKRAAESQSSQAQNTSEKKDGKNAVKQPGVENQTTKTEDSKTGVTLRPSEFIHYVDQQLAGGNIAIGFDYGQLPNYKTAFTAK